VYWDIRGGSSERGRQMTLQWGCRRQQFLAICLATSLATSRDKTSNITWRYATRRRPVIDCQVNDLE